MSGFGSILKKRFFWPLFGSQALGAFNDNFYRAALAAYIVYQATGYSPEEKVLLNSLGMGLMMLPFFLFSSLAGELADRFSKSTLVKITKGSELAVMCLAALCFYLESVPLLLLTLFLMGAQSSFFGPLKYGLLPEILPARELVGGNGLVEAATFVAIVFGTLLGNYLVGLEGPPAVAIAVMLVAAAGFGLSLFLPRSAQSAPDNKIDPNIIRSTRNIISSVKGRPSLWLAILAISWFWAVGGVFISQMPNLVHGVIGGELAINTFLMTLFCLGVGLGSIAIQWILKGDVSARLAPGASALMALFMIDLALAATALPAPGAEPLTLGEFLGRWEYLRLSGDCFLISLLGGVYVVPLNAILQHLAGVDEKARVIAANNIINAVFIVLGSLLVMAMTAVNLSLIAVFGVLAASGVLAAILTLYFLPQASLRTLARLLLEILYHPKVKGLEHIRDLEGGPALLIANHVSFLDVVLLVAYVPRDLTFAINSAWAKVWWIKPLLSIVTALPVDPMNPLATRGLIEALSNGQMVVIFPEGRISDTGCLMKVYEGPAMVASHAKAPLLPVVIDGPQYSRIFGRFVKTLNWKPSAHIKMTVLPARRLDVPAYEGERHREQRRRSGEMLYDLMSNSAFEALDHNQSLWTAMMAAGKREGFGRGIIEDVRRERLSWRKFVWMSKIMGRRFAERSAPGESVGVLLPNSTPAVATLFGLWAAGRVAVMLNYTQGPGPLNSAVKTALLKTVITSRAFVEQLNLGDLIINLPVQIIYLEDLQTSFMDKLRGILWRPRPAAGQSPAVVLFTSGSEGRPKGVALSHRNMLSNIQQVKSQVQLNQKDVMFNALPMFHSFGLTVGTILPFIIGMRSFVYVSPLHAKNIPELIYDSGATMTCASDTFAAAWGKSAHPYDFARIHLMLVGAEKLKDSTRRLYAEKLGVRLCEGYGVTETAPVLSVNTPMFFRAGTVGRILPGIETRIDPVEGVAEGGVLAVRGENVMMGYIRAEEPGVIQPVEDGWHSTGDIVTVDHDGYITIRGRHKRFAKIAGEMVSLAAVEEVAAGLWPGRVQVLAAMPDEKKGEKLLFVTQEESVDMPALWAALKSAGFPELAFPRDFVRLTPIPQTPLGKIDMPKLMEALLAKFSAPQ